MIFGVALKFLKENFERESFYQLILRKIFSVEFSEQYRIIVIDDHPVVLNGVQLLLNNIKNVICTTASNIKEFKEISSQQFDLLILDLELSDTNGFQVINIAREINPQCRILIYSMHEEPWVLSRLIPYNIDGVLSKNSSPSQLIATVNSIIKGEKVFTEAYNRLYKRKNPYIANKDIAIELSQREKEVLAYISQGYTTREIADMIFLSVNTVSTYRKRLMQKLQARNVADLVLRGKKLIFNPLPPIK